MLEVFFLCFKVWVMWGQGKHVARWWAGELLSKSFIDFPMAAELWEASHTYFHGKLKHKEWGSSLFWIYFRYWGCIILTAMEIPSIWSLCLFVLQTSLGCMWKSWPCFPEIIVENECLQKVNFLSKRESIGRNQIALANVQSTFVHPETSHR